MKEPNIEFLVETAREAGEIIMAGYGKKHQVDFKGEIDLVTEVDIKAEQIILSRIREKFPEHKIVAEEEGISNLEGTACWYIDPIDGTVNYAHDIPFFCVSIAFGYGTDIQMGVVYEPGRDEVFMAEKGKGAFLNGEQLRASIQTDLNKCLLTTGFSYDIRTRKNTNLENYADFALITQGVRRLGSAALDACYVAAGRFDGFWELTMGPWDIAAAQLIAREAGAKVTGIDGSTHCLEEPISIIAANPVLHQKIAEIVLKNAEILGQD